MKTIPAVREALEQRKWSQAESGINSVSEILKREAALVNDAAADLEKAGH